MPLPRESAAPTVVVLDAAASTNDELRARVPGAAEFTVVATTNQTGGRGRLGRTWIAPPGQCLAASVLLRPASANGTPVDIERWGWMPLLAGVAMTRAVQSVVPGSAPSLKWPNDVLVRGRKVCGILAELLPGGDGVIVGAGVNLTIPDDALPVPTATSLLIEAAATGDPLPGDLARTVLDAWLAELRPLYAGFITGDSDARDSVVATCSTPGQTVRVELPDGSTLLGDAVDIDDSGRLVVTGRDGARQAVAAGDVTHLRYE
ncbi:biotin--[acetyl-CoA-carboxylase] ligase [Marisediminicola senii]|uniref:biotin--[acetyl-CoA-carboxylase] ligase n=1 Tax=Marisediminicola senii TaxID=2711233 RepID=UPI0013EA1AA0|nr:biotin--[acetyl-CoA-carboxylase] ligase [Marisediminicola senii]